MNKFVKSKNDLTRIGLSHQLRSRVVAAILGAALVTGAMTLVPIADSYAKGALSTLRILASETGLSRSVKLGLNKSLVVELPSDAHDILLQTRMLPMRLPERHAGFICLANKSVRQIFSYLMAEENKFSASN